MKTILIALLGMNALHAQTFSFQLAREVQGTNIVWAASLPKSENVVHVRVTEDGELITVVIRLAPTVARERLTATAANRPASPPVPVPPPLPTNHNASFTRAYLPVQATESVTNGIMMDAIVPLNAPSAKEVKAAIDRVFEQKQKQKQ